MAFSLRSPKLFGGSEATLKISVEASKVLEIPENFVEILKISEKREMLTLSVDFRDFHRVPGPILNLMASFWIRSLRRFFGDSRT
jgi:hypothetical protein